MKWIPEGDEDALAEALIEVGPLSVVINTGDEKFQFYKSGQCRARTLEMLDNIQS